MNELAVSAGNPVSGKKVYTGNTSYSEGREFGMSKSNWDSQVTQEWNRNAANWHSRSREMWESGSRKTVLPLFARLVAPDSGPVLDAGCGDGYASLKLARQGYRVQGVDISDDMIQLANRQAAGVNGVTFQTGDVTRLPFADGAFAGILSINVVEWTEQPLAALEEFHRLLRPGGVLLLGILGPTAGPRGYSYPRLYGKPTIQNR